ncbi:MAG: hypothetical protein K6G22_00740 [Lachnospiraceae bacterium]|nr:hypothetical protein [Lachnospiraceae bacterium]
MNDKKKGIVSLITACLILVILEGCGSKDVSFCGLWDYPEYNVRIQIFEDNTWEMMDETGSVVAGGDCQIDGKTAELYYSFGSPWEDEDGPVMYNVLHFEKKGKLTDGVGYTIVRADD